MITQKDFYELAKRRPELKDAYYAAVTAIIDYRMEAAKQKSGLIASAWLYKKQYTAAFKLEQVPSGVAFNGAPIDETDRAHIKEWVKAAANFHMLSRQGQDALMIQHADVLAADNCGVTKDNDEEVLEEIEVVNDSCRDSDKGDGSKEASKMRTPESPWQRFDAILMAKTDPKEVLVMVFANPNGKAAIGELNATTWCAAKEVFEDAPNDWLLTPKSIAADRGMAGELGALCRQLWKRQCRVGASIDQGPVLPLNE